MKNCKRKWISFGLEKKFIVVIMKRKGIGKILSGLCGLFCLGCATESMEGLPRYDGRSGESYYAWLYRDSAFIDCTGDPYRPWNNPLDIRQYMRIYLRIARHLVIKDTVSWDFTAEEIKVAPYIFDYLVEKWTEDNIKIQTGWYVKELLDRAYRLRPTRDDVDLIFIKHEKDRDYTKRDSSGLSGE